MTGSYDAALRPILAPLTNDLREVLGEDLVGLYLYGSAVSGGFDNGASDLDLVAVTKPAVKDLNLGQLDAVHRRVVERDSSWQDRLEVVYVARSTLTGLVGQDPVAVISPGEPFHVTGPASDWLQNWYLVRETGVSLAGGPANDVIAPISRAAYLAAIRGYLGYLRGAEPSSYGVLSACRALRTLETGAPCSKQEAAAWMRDRRPEWAWLIDAALEDRRRRGKSGFGADATGTAAHRFVELASMWAG
jgi:hypothetical protein